MNRSLLLTRSSQFCCSLASLFSVYSSLTSHRCGQDCLALLLQLEEYWQSHWADRKRTGWLSSKRTILRTGPQVASAVYEANSNLVGPHLPLLLSSHARSLAEGGRWNLCRTACRSAHRNKQLATLVESSVMIYILNHTRIINQASGGVLGKTWPAVKDFELLGKLWYD